MAGYDVAVIGAGLAGLTAAGYLAKAGARVVVCEQAAQVGGLWNSFWREGYLFDGGIKAVENAGLMLPTLRQLGVLDRVHFAKSPIALITETTVQPIRNAEDLDAYFAHLMALFPAERDGLEHVQGDARRIFDLLGALLHFPGLFPDAAGEGGGASSWFRENLGTFARAPKILSLMNTPLRRYVERRIGDPHLANLLCDIFPEGTTAFFGLAYFGIFLDYHYPEGGIQAVPRALAEAIQGWGGEILLGARVERIRLESGRACGVTLADGRQIDARYVLAASDARQTFNKLLPPEALPGGFLAKLEQAETSHTAFNVFLGLDLPVERLNLQGCGHVFYAPDLQGITEEDRLTREDYFAHVPQEISVPCLHDPSLAPAGKTGLNLSAMTSWHYADNWGLQNGQPTERYQQLQERFSQQMIESMQRFIPDLEQHIELRVIGTPYTLHTRTLNSEGAIMGWSYNRKRTWYRGGFLQIAKSVMTPIPNLLMAGHWAFSPGGSPTAVLTGKIAADRILKDG